MLYFFCTLLPLADLVHAIISTLEKYFPQRYQWRTSCALSYFGLPQFPWPAITKYAESVFPGAEEERAYCSLLKEQ
jgi:hypothetical protein